MNKFFHIVTAAAKHAFLGATEKDIRKHCENCLKYAPDCPGGGGRKSLMANDHLYLHYPVCCKKISQAFIKLFLYCVNC